MTGYIEQQYQALKQKASLHQSAVFSSDGQKNIETLCLAMY